MALATGETTVGDALPGASALPLTQPTAPRFVVIAAMIAFVCTLSAAAVVDAQEEEEAAPAGNLARFEIPANQFDSWVFQNRRDVTAARRQLEKFLELNLDDVNQVCNLAAGQRKKLDLAGRGDIKRFFEQVEVVRRKFLLVRNDQNKFNNIWQEIQPLQTTFRAGLCGTDSLFHKTLQHTLTREQMERYSQHEQARQRFQYRARVELVVATLETALPLRDEQREKLITLILEQTKPPRQFGNSDFYVVMANLSEVPESQLKPLFDQTEWRILKSQFEQVRGWKRVNNAVVVDEE